MKIRKAILTLTVLFSLCSLAGGIAVVKEPAYVLKEDLRIGVEYGDDNCMFAAISDAGLDSTDSIYILDNKNFRIQVFDDSGGFLNSIALAKGQGPEEISNFARMAILPDGTISLLDFYERKVVLLTKAGAFLRSFKLDFHINDIAAADDTLIALGLNDNHILHEIDLDGRLLNSFGDLFSLPSNLSAYKEMVQLRMPMRLDRASSGEIFLLNPFAYELFVFKNGVQSGKIEGDNPIFKPMRIAKSGGNALSIISPLAYVHRSGGLVLSTIVETRGLSESIGHMDIIQDGKILGTLTLKGLPQAVDSRGRLLVSEQEDIPQLVRYTITPSGTGP
jgi:hypothetical protein